MQIICEHFSKEYANEAVNIMLMDLVLIRDPHKKIGNLIFKWRLFLVISALWTVINFYWMWKYRSVILEICFAVMLVVTVIVCLYVIWAANNLKELLRPNRRVEWTFDPEGISFRLENRYEIRFFWEMYQCLRICNHGIFFIPKEKGKGNVVALPAEYKEQVTGFLEESGIDIKVVHENP